MSKRAYSIPLVGLALSSIGCGGDDPPPPPPPEVDEVANSNFQVDVFNGYATPASYVGIDVSAAQDGSVLCDITYSNSDVSFDAALDGNTTYAINFTNCVDAAGAPADPALIPPDETQLFTVQATAVTVNANYNITLTSDAGVETQLDGCTFADGVLDCAGNLTLTKL